MAHMVEWYHPHSDAHKALHHEATGCPYGSIRAFMNVVAFWQSVAAKNSKSLKIGTTVMR